MFSLVPPRLRGLAHPDFSRIVHERLTVHLGHRPPAFTTATRTVAARITEEQRAPHYTVTVCRKAPGGPTATHPRATRKR